ncbi:mRNA export factor GLE1-like [Glandiceps talaboti]
MSSTIDALRSSNKGQLKYDLHWHEKGKIQTVLEECTSPPTLSLKSIREVLDSIDYSIAETESLCSQQSSDSSGPPVRVRSIENNIDSSDSESSSLEQSITKSPHASIEVALKHFEKDYEKQAESAVKLRKDKLEQHCHMLKERAEQQIAMIEEKQELLREKALQRLQTFEARKTEESKRRQLKRKEHVKDQAKTLELKLRAAEARRVQILEEEKKEEQEKILHNLLVVQNQLNLYTDRTIQLVTNCKYKQHLAENTASLSDYTKQLKEFAAVLVADAKKKEATLSHLDKMNKVYVKAKQLVEQVNKLVGEAERKGKEAEEKKKKAEEEAAAANKKAEAAAAAAAAAATTAAASNSAATAAASSAIDDLETTVTPDALKVYEELQEKRKVLVESCKELMETKDPQLKKYKFELQKAVNSTVNTISRQSGRHLLSKIQKLHTLLSGRPVEVTGKQVSAASHPAGVAFCKELLAKKLVKQGDEQVSSSLDSAFPIALVAVGVWSDFPDFGELLLAHFHLACPYLVPYYILQKTGQSDEDHYKVLGYKYIDGQIEKQDKFLRRMTGICRLYAAIMQTQSPKGPMHPNPHGLDEAWKWFSRILNIYPRPDVTATMIYDVLTVCGHSMANTYGRQFNKVLVILIKEYYSKIEDITPRGSGGPVARLRIFLETCLKKNAVPPPEGRLPSDFLRT